MPDAQPRHMPHPSSTHGSVTPTQGWPLPPTLPPRWPPHPEWEPGGKGRAEVPSIPPPPPAALCNSVWGSSTCDSSSGCSDGDEPGRRGGRDGSATPQGGPIGRTGIVAGSTSDGGVRKGV